MRPVTPTIWVFLLTSFVTSLSVQPARCGYSAKSYTFTDSNTFADGVDYGTIFVESYDGIGADGGTGLLFGQIRLTLTVNTAPYTTINTKVGKFGFQSFGFNYDNLSLTQDDITAVPPDGWTIDLTPSGGGFGPYGKFEITADADKGNLRRDPLVILISNQGVNAQIANVTHLSTTGSENSYFSAHVAGFTVAGSGATSHKIAVTDLGDGDLPAVPAPAGVVLLASALPFAFCLRRRLKREVAA